MNIEYRNQINVKQNINLQLLKSLNILQSSCLTIRTLINNEVQSNPMLIYDDNDTTTTNNYWNYNNENYENLINKLTYKKTLQDYLREQLYLLNISPKDKIIIEYIIGSLNQSGFFNKQDLDFISTKLKVSQDTVINMLNIVKKLDPPGIACENIQESLLIQLMYKNKHNSLAYIIIKNYFELLIKNNLLEISKKLKISLKELNNNLKIIKSLNIPPIKHFQITQDKIYNNIIPDIIIHKTNNQFVIHINKEFIPLIKINNEYTDLLKKENLNKKDNLFIQKKINEGKHFIESIRKRDITLTKITQSLIDKNFDFFNKKTKILNPLTITKIANQLNIKQSTASRAIANKYILTPFGLFYLRNFFNLKTISIKDIKHSLYNNIKNSIINIILKEKLDNPYSDQKISELLLLKNNIDLKRRTVSKYRNLIGIPNASKRKIIK